jgi:hypothetical protein
LFGGQARDVLIGGPGSDSRDQDGSSGLSCSCYREVVTYCIRGTKFEDLDGDATLDAGEPVIPTWEVTLDGHPDGNPRTTTTGADGAYAFCGLPRGTYTVSTEPRPGQAITGPQGGAYRVELFCGDLEGLDFACAPGPPAIVLTKALSGGFRSPDDQELRWQFTLTVENQGSAPAVPGPVVDELPEGLAFLSGSAGWSCAAIGQVVTCQRDPGRPPLAGGASETIVLTVEPVIRDAFRDLTNCARLSPGGAPACASLPCPSGPGVRILPEYQETRDPAVCAAAGPAACLPGESWFWGTCGCGCKTP